MTECRCCRCSSGDGERNSWVTSNRRLTKDQIGRELLDAVMTVVEPLIAERDSLADLVSRVAMESRYPGQDVAGLPEHVADLHSNSSKSGTPGGQQRHPRDRPGSGPVADGWMCRDCGHPDSPFQPDDSWQCERHKQ